MFCLSKINKVSFDISSTCGNFSHEAIGRLIKELKRCAQFNDIDGRLNILVKVQGPVYKNPEKMILA